MVFDPHTAGPVPISSSSRSGPTVSFGLDEASCTPRFIRMARPWVSMAIARSPRQPSTLGSSPSP